MTDVIDDSGAAMPNIQAPDISPSFDINPSDSVFQAPSLPVPSIMGGVNFPDSGLPMLGSDQPIPWTVASGAQAPVAMPSFGQGGAQAPDRAKGIGEAVEGTKVAAEGSRGLGVAVGGLAAGSLEAAKTDPVLRGLRDQIPWIAGPLTAAKGVADTIGDVQNGAPVSEAALGNTVRSGLVLGATWAPEAIPVIGETIGPLIGAGTGWAADKLLPSGAVIGHSLLHPF